MSTDERPDSDSHVDELRRTTANKHYGLLRISYGGEPARTQFLKLRIQCRKAWGFKSPFSHSYPTELRAKPPGCSQGMRRR